MNNELAVEPTSPVRVVVVDPRPERRSLVRFMLQTGGTNALVTGEAGTRAEAVAMVDTLDVDALVLEIQMPVEEGLRTIADVRMRTPRVRIAVCSFLDDSTTRMLAVDA